MKPRATYRLQFHRTFTFSDALKLVSYFAQLGISHLYSSPILMARAGSMHGYDVVDHGRVNPELGGEEGFRALATELRKNGIGVILDIVPNHMAVGGADNPYWLDVLEKGRDSIFANLFDIDWEPAQANLRDKILVPLLGKPVPDCLADGEITLVWDERLGKFAFAYAEHRFPLRKDDYADVMGDAAPADADLARYSGPAALRDMLERQNFRLAYWRSAGERINWRRFFDITSLAALRVEDDAVFEQTHATVFRLYSEGMIDGVRIDHVDGLADPEGYCRRLRARLEAMTPLRPEALPREPAIILVEKILAEREQLPTRWEVDGTTGYDFMNLLSGLKHDPSSEAAFTALWSELSGRPADFETEERQARGEMLDTAFASALRGTATAFQRLHDEGTLPASAFETALEKVLEHFRAYRTYALGDRTEPPPGPFFEQALQAAEREVGEEERDALAIIAATMRGEESSDGVAAAEAVRRFNQLAAPVAAKAVEDTAFYRYGRLLSRNDVGFTPGRFSVSPDEFHQANLKRQADFPCALLATASHDHKRGEDTRARLAALSEIPEEWEREVRTWFDLNTPVRPDGVGAGDEYQLYQTLVACRPFGLSGGGEGLAAFTRRILAWREKSLKEAKLETSWAKPNPGFEAAHAEFIKRILDPDHGFLLRLEKFANMLAPAGALNSLVSCVLKCTCPGVPDIYQGTELWDLSLVDPDNRRPVDFHIRAEMLNAALTPAAALKDWRDGEVKLALLARLLPLRAAEPALFRGDYGPIETGTEQMFAFARRAEGKTLVVAVPRLCAKAAIARACPLPDETLGAACDLSLGQSRWRDALDPALPEVPAPRNRPLFAEFPALVLLAS